MADNIINNKYQIIDTLLSNSQQSIYLVEDNTKYNMDQLIANVFSDPEIVSKLRTSFANKTQNGLKNFVEAFDVETGYCIVGKVCTGNTLEVFLSENSLRLADKMYLAESYLSQLSSQTGIDPFIVNAVCVPECLSVAGKRNICFNLNFQLNKDTLDLTITEAIKSIGITLTAIFKNTVSADVYDDRDNLPPAIGNIISKCMTGGFNAISEVYSDFKSSLLFTTFIESTSLDTQLVKNISKAKRKKKTVNIKKPLITLASILLVVFGLWMIWRGGMTWIDTKTSSKNPIIHANTKPVASFSVSSNKIYQGEEVLFTNTSLDQDLLDKVAKSEWSIYKDNTFVTDSQDYNLKYTFNDPGTYSITLIVTDTRGAASIACKTKITVLPQQQIPPPNGSDNSSDVK